VILARVKEPQRLGICLDSCHIFAAGYSLAPGVEYHETMNDLDRAVGIARVRVWHLNDSRRERGSRVDRHAGIGRGHLGLEPFRLILNDPRFQNVSMILETPKGVEEGEELDLLNLRALRGLEAEPIGAASKKATGSCLTPTPTVSSTPTARAKRPRRTPRSSSTES
jgi:deoxyribonuclease IV